MDASIRAPELRQSLRSSEPPRVIDVRRRERFRESPYLLHGALLAQEGKSEIHTWNPQAYR
jgi:hypothetical protein